MKLTQITPINLHVVQIIEPCNRDVERIPEENPVEVEKTEMLLKAENRFLRFKKILYGIEDNEIPCYVSFYGIAGILLAVLTNLSTTQFPMRDAISNPLYLQDVWPTKLVGLIMTPVNILLMFRFWTNTKCIFTIKHFGLALLLFVVIMTVYVLILNGIWAKILGYRLPMPFMQCVVGTSGTLFYSIALWCLIPVEWRKSKKIKKRYRFFIATAVYYSMSYYQYIAFSIIFEYVPLNRQWSIAIMLPLLREVNIWIIEMLAQKSADGTDTSVTIATTHLVNTRHCIFLAVMVGTKATNLSSWIILLADFFYNLYLTLKIIWIKKTKPNNEKNNLEMFHLLFSLTINELIEVVMPMTFLVCFLFAYYGPNAEIIGGVKSSHFHYEPVTNINGFVQKMILFLLVDLFSVIFVGTLLWLSCKINLIRAYMTMQEEFWSIITLPTTFATYVVISQYMINDI